jgi:RNA polymerase sigma-70 factor (ECF subfamily)
MTDFRREEPFQAFVAGKRDSWVKMAFSILKNREEAEDSVQETLALLWEKKDSLEVQNPSAYAARAVWVNALRRRERTKLHLALDEIPELSEAPRQEEFFWEMDPLHLEGALEELPETQRAVVRMKYYMGLSFKEIGIALSISLNTAASRCRYALEALRESLGPEDPPSGENHRNRFGGGF